MGRSGLGVIPPSDGCRPRHRFLGRRAVTRKSASTGRQTARGRQLLIELPSAWLTRHQATISRTDEGDDTTPPSCLQPRPAAPQWLAASQARMARAQSSRRPEGLHERNVLSWERGWATLHGGRSVPAWIGADEAEEEACEGEDSASEHFRSSLFLFLPARKTSSGQVLEPTPRQMPPPLASHAPVPSPAAQPGAQLAQAADAAQLSHSPAGADNCIVPDRLDGLTSTSQVFPFCPELNTSSLRLSLGSIPLVVFLHFHFIFSHLSHSTQARKLPGAAARSGRRQDPAQGS